jgi:ubiquinone/menaquinone biosynthesis C-methylase UbiE
VTQTREVTAAQDADDWDVYWESGRRDLSILLTVGTLPGPLGKDVVLDLGCGIGRLARPLVEQFAHVVCADISSEMLAKARANLADENVRFTLVESDCRLDAADSSVDAIIAWTVFRHTPKSVFERYLGEASRLLKPGGRLLFEAQLRLSGEITNPPDHQPVTEREYSREELSQYCGRAGLKWVADQIAPSITPETVTLILAWEK